MVLVSTLMKPRSSISTPASSAPMPSVTGRRPIDTSTWSTSILSEPLGVSNGTMTPVSVCCSAPTLASAWILVPRLASDLASTLATSRSGPIGSTPSFIASSSVVSTPRSV